MNKTHKGMFCARLTLGLLVLSAWGTISAAQGASLEIPAKGQEQIVYEIRKFKLKVGEAVLTFEGPVVRDERPMMLVTFKAKGLNFFDHEKIYLDPGTYYPILIERDLNIFGNKEMIVEYYDEQQGRVRIVKTARGKTTEQILSNGERFDNIYGFIYRYRQSGGFGGSDELRLHLPTRDVSFKRADQKKFVAAGREFQAYRLYSQPRQYEVWFDTSSQRIPLLIDGAVGFGQTSMVMTTHTIEG